MEYIVFIIRNSEIWGKFGKKEAKKAKKEAKKKGSNTQNFT